MDNQEELSHKQSLELIEEMIYKAKNSYHESGTSALLWGGTIMFCSTVSFVNTWLKIDWLYMVWWLRKYRISSRQPIIELPIARDYPETIYLVQPKNNQLRFYPSLEQ